MILETVNFYNLKRRNNNNIYKYIYILKNIKNFTHIISFVYVDFIIIIIIIIYFLVRQTLFICRFNYIT